jgi:hypothetical protein
MFASLVLCENKVHVNIVVPLLWILKLYDDVTSGFLLKEAGYIGTGRKVLKSK